MEPTVEYLELGEADDARRIAVLRRPGKTPGLFWLNGYRSDMRGSKASALDAFGAEHGIAVTRFDHSGNGESGGDFLDGTISRWLEESLAVFDTTTGPQVIVGSSLGAWLALLMARALRTRGEERVKALVLIAPAVDATSELMTKRMTKAQRATLERDGVVNVPSKYSDQPYPYTKRLIDDGNAHHLLFGRGIDVGAPVTILQGGKDPDVPREHAVRLVQHLLTDPVTFTLIPDGDHRLSREQDLQLLRGALERAIETPPEQLTLALD